MSDESSSGWFLVIGTVAVVLALVAVAAVFLFVKRSSRAPVAPQVAATNPTQAFSLR